MITHTQPEAQGQTPQLDSAVCDVTCAPSTCVAAELMDSELAELREAAARRPVPHELPVVNVAARPCGDRLWFGH